MNWNNLLSSDRVRSYTSAPNSADLRSEFEKDYHRIIGSASFRRLQDKTQVFPLDKSDFIRTRLTHSMEVSSIARSLGQNIGQYIIRNGRDEYFDLQMQADISSIVQCAGLIHDIGKALTHEIEGSHVAIGVDIAKKYKESPEIIHAIEAHHNDVEPKTIVACLVQAADAISAARPGARRENLENYIKRLEKLEEIANSFNGVEKCFAIQAGREIRVMIKPDVISDDQMVITAREIAKKIEDEMEYPGQIKVNLIRETRSVDYAK